MRTEQPLSQGMQRISYGISKFRSLKGWLIGEWPDDGLGLQLAQPDGSLFV